MKITCVKSELSSALSIVSKAIASKPQTPILAGIFLRAENNILELHATIALIETNVVSHEFGEDR